MANRKAWFDKGFRGVLGVFSLAPLLVFVALLVYLIQSSSPAFHLMGWHFFTEIRWTLGNLYATHAVTSHGQQIMPGAIFGAKVFIVGTVLTSFIALILATPLAFFVAACSAFLLPARLRVPVSALIEMMAGIPSVIFGLWGITELAPYVVHKLGPVLNHIFSPLPFVSGPIQSETNLLAASIVLMLMIMPIIAATSRAVMERTPKSWLEAGRALGWTESELFWRVTWPYTRSSLVGAMILGMGRALGETMAVLMVSGNALNILPQDWYSSVSTMAATIAAQLDSAFTDPTKMAVHALGAIGLVLFVITIFVNLLARAMVPRGVGAFSNAEGD